MAPVASRIRRGHLTWMIVKGVRNPTLIQSRFRESGLKALKRNLSQYVQLLIVA